MARSEIPPGTLDMLILRTLAQHQELHGFGIAECIRRTTSSVLNVEEGSLYPALQRMLLQDWIAGEWGHTDEGRRARYYTLTPAGRKQLVREVKAWERVSRAIAQILNPDEQGGLAT
ncbi:MAG: transcriptional regulator, PadR family [Gemmatimonadetes bacterium]|nr:transcriptional regulator, PadR family [Gemmatimonadota bacterium]